MRRILGFGALLVGLVLPGATWARPVTLKLTKTKITLRGKRPTRKAVRGKLLRGLPGIKTCVRGAVKDKRRYSGWLWLNFRFTGTGRVYGVSVTSTLSNRFVHKCIDMTLRQWKMPKGKGGSVTTAIAIRK